MQSKTSTLFLSAALLALIAMYGAGVALAQTETTSTVTETGLSQGDQSRIINLAANMSNRADAAIKRFDAIGTRFDSRIKKLEVEGYNMSTVWPLVQSAKEAVFSASTLVGNMDTDIFAVVESTNPKETWSTTRQNFANIKQDLLRAQDFYQKALTEMKTIVAQGVPQQQAGTSTEATVTTPVMQ